MQAQQAQQAQQVNQVLHAQQAQVQMRWAQYAQPNGLLSTQPINVEAHYAQHGFVMQRTQQQLAPQPPQPPPPQLPQQQAAVAACANAVGEGGEKGGGESGGYSSGSSVDGRPGKRARSGESGGPLNFISPSKHGSVVGSVGLERRDSA